jgi:single-stranded-DNA-specific exonuclease
VDEGYGLNAEAISQIAEGGAKLIVSVDCGITAFTAAPVCRQKGIDLIITDHHRPSNDGLLPEAVAIVHPNLDPNYPAQYSSGAAVAFKLAWAVVNKIKNGATTPQHLRQFLINATIFAAMGTIADVVDLRGENRIITSFGLRAIADSNLPGIEALINVAGIKGQTIDSFHIDATLEHTRSRPCSA